MAFDFSDKDIYRGRPTLESVSMTIDQLLDWNKGVNVTEDFYGTQSGMQLLAADYTLITAIGEGINRVNRLLPGFLEKNFPDVPWFAIIGMHNHIAHGYFELDAELIYDAIKNDFPGLRDTVKTALNILEKIIDGNQS